MEFFQSATMVVISLVLICFVAGIWFFINSRGTDSSVNKRGHRRSERQSQDDDTEAGVDPLISRASLFGIMQEPYHGVAFRLGKSTSWEIRPGLYWRLPLLYKVYKVSTAGRKIDVAATTVVFKDKISADIRPTLVVKVDDPRRFMVSIEEFETIISDLAISVVTNLTSNTDSITELNSTRESINRNMADELNELIEKFGVEVINFSIADIDIDRGLLADMAEASIAREKAEASKIAAEAESEIMPRMIEELKRTYPSLTEGDLLKAAVELRKMQTIGALSQGPGLLLGLDTPT